VCIRGTRLRLRTHAAWCLRGRIFCCVDAHCGCRSPHPSSSLGSPMSTTRHAFLEPPGLPPPAASTAFSTLAPMLPPLPDIPLSAFPNHPVTATLVDGGLCRQWLLPPRPPRGTSSVWPSAATTTALPAGLTTAGLGQAVGFTSAVAASDGSASQHVHGMVCGRRGQ